MQDPLSSINEKLAEISSRLDHSPNSTSEWLDINEAAEYLKLSKSAIYKRSMDGTIPLYKTGKKLLFSRSELHEYIQKGKVESTPLPSVMIEK